MAVPTLLPLPFAVGDQSLGRGDRGNRVVLEVSWQHPELMRDFHLLWWCDWRERWGFGAHPALALSSTFHQPCWDHIDKITGITRALGSYWDIIRVLVHFPGCFPVRGGTAGIMDGADVCREGSFSLHGWLMPCTGQCWEGEVCHPRYGGWRKPLVLTPPHMH